MHQAVHEALTDITQAKLSTELEKMIENYEGWKIEEPSEA
jgi:hypothetical protein